MREVVIVAACRTAIGKFGGTLQPLSDIDFGPIPIKEVMKRGGITGDQVDEVIYASGYRTGDLPINSARVVAVKAGISIEKPQFTISKACAGSVKAVTLAAQVIKSGDADIIIAGGMESMSNATFMLKQARWGYRLGHGQLQDQLILFDPLSGNTMGETAENVAVKYNVSREDQDAFALRSQQLAEKAIKEGKFKEQIVPVEIPGKKGPVIFDTDEHPRFGTTMESLQKLKPAFVKNGGTVTAGNASGMNDGAFPRHPAKPGFDLLPGRPRKGDRSRREEDLALFLDALLMARDHLYISTTGFGPRDAGIIPPAPVVSQLLDQLREVLVTASSSSLSVEEA